eukprot:4999524-Pleurochrysis_carterae.AAC.1
MGATGDAGGAGGDGRGHGYIRTVRSRCSGAQVHDNRIRTRAAGGEVGRVGGRTVRARVGGARR